MFNNTVSTTFSKASNGARIPADWKFLMAVFNIDVILPRLIFSNLLHAETIPFCVLSSSFIFVLSILRLPARLICESLFSILPASEPDPTTVKTYWSKFKPYSANVSANSSASNLSLTVSSNKLSITVLSLSNALGNFFFKSTATANTELKLSAFNRGDIKPFVLSSAIARIWLALIPVFCSSSNIFFWSFFSTACTNCSMYSRWSPYTSSDMFNPTSLAASSSSTSLPSTTLDTFVFPVGSIDNSNSLINWSVISLLSSTRFSALTIFFSRSASVAIRMLSIFFLPLARTLSVAFFTICFAPKALAASSAPDKASIVTASSSCPSFHNSLLTW